MPKITIKNYFLLIFLMFSTTSFGETESKLTVKEFLEEADLRDVELSPNGRYLAMIWSQGQARILLVKDLESPETPTIGMMKEEFIRPSSVYWANNERLLVNVHTPFGLKHLIKKSKTEEDFDIRKYRSYIRTMSLDIHTKNPVVLMEQKGRRTAAITNFLPNDQHHVQMQSFDGRRRTLHKVNVYTGEAKLITKAGKRTYKIITDTDGKPLYRLDYYWIAKEIEIFEFTDAKEWVQIDSIHLDEDDEEGIETEGLLKFGITKDSDLVYRRRNKKTGYYEIFTRKKGTKEIKVLVSLENQDVRSSISNTRTNTIIGYSVEKDLVRYHYFDKTKQQEYDVLSQLFKNENFIHYSYTENTTKAIVKTYGQDNPGAFYIYDNKTKQLTFIGSQYKKLSPDKIGIPAMVNIKTRNGDKIRAYILFPPNYDNKLQYPMVIMPHGGPQGRDNASFDRFAQFVATRGYIVIQPNFHGSTGYGLDFEKSGYKQWGRLMQDDLTDTVNYMIKKGYANEDKVCIVGGSYGGYAALMGAVKTPALYKCAVSINGVSHLKKRIKNSIKATQKKYKQQIINTQYERMGHPIREAGMLNKHSPALHADKIEIPILLIVGEEDERVSVKQSKLMANALEDEDKSFEFVKIKGAGHNIFRYYEHAEKVYNKIEIFLATHLQ